MKKLVLATVMLLSSSANASGLTTEFSASNALSGINPLNYAGTHSIGQQRLSDSIGFSEEDVRNYFLNHLHTNYIVSKNPVAQDYVRRIGNKIVSANSISMPFSFYVVEDESINAFAGPAGIVAVNTGLISKAENEDEVAAVIAHEIAHVTQAHLSRGYSAKEAASNLAMGLMAGYLAASGSVNPDVSAATAKAIMGLQQSKILANSRTYEHEADHVGLTLLDKAGYNPKAMHTFFDKLEQTHNKQDPSMEFLMTHPLTQKRLSKSFDRAEQLEGANRGFITVDHSTIVDSELNLSDSTLPELYLKHELNPSKLTPLLSVIKLLESKGEIEKAESYLSSWVERLEYPALAYSKLAELNNQLRNIGRAYYFEALKSELQGNRERYQALLKNAKKQLKDDSLIADINLRMVRNDA